MAKTYRDLSLLEPDIDFTISEKRERARASHYKWHVAKYLSDAQMNELNAATQDKPVSWVAAFWRRKLSKLVRCR